MAEEAETPENEEELLLTEEVEQEESAQTEEAQPEEEEEVIGFGDEITDEKPDDTGLVKHLREQLKKAQKEAAEARRTAQPEPEIEIGEKPTIEGCEWDSDRFDREYDEWKERKASAEKKAAERNKATEDEAARWQAQLERVEKEKASLAKADTDEAFDTVKAALNLNQQAALVEATDGNTARLIYALAKNPERLTNLAGETNLVRFIKEVAKLEGQLKMVKRRKAPDPDVPQRGSAPTSIATNAAQKQLEKMEREWKGGDRSHIQKFKRENGLK